MDKLEDLCQDFVKDIGGLSGRVEGIHGEIGFFKGILQKNLALPERARLSQGVTVPARDRAVTANASRTAPQNAENGYTDYRGTASCKLPKGEQIILNAIAQYPEGVTTDQLQVLTGYKSTSRKTYVQKLRAAGLIDERNGYIVATDEGIKALGSSFAALPTGQALYEYWKGRLPEGERRIFEVIYAAHPDSVTNEAIESATGYASTSRKTYLQKLKGRKIVQDAERGSVVAAAHLFN